MRKQLLNLKTADLLAELKKRQRAVPRLESRRNVLLARLGKIDAQIAHLDGMHDGHPRKRHHNSKPLGEALAAVVGAKPMTISQTIDAVLKSGYKTTAANFRVIVNQTLINDKRFKKAGRGLYVLK